MNDKLILVLGACGLGTVSAGACGLCFLFSRPYRKALNRIAILFSQFLVGTLALSGLFLLQKLQAILAPDTKFARELGVYAYLFGLFSVGFLVVRAEVLWQRSWRQVRAIGEQLPIVPEARRRLFVVLAIMGSSWVFAGAYLLNRTKPLAPLLFGTSLLSLFAAMIFIGRVLGHPKTSEIRQSIVVAAGLLICFVGFIAFRSRVTAPTQTSSWIVSAAAPCIAVLAAVLFLRSESGTRNS
jgi:hypothetical protein